MIEEIFSGILWALLIVWVVFQCQMLNDSSKNKRYGYCLTMLVGIVLGMVVNFTFLIVGVVVTFVYYLTEYKENNPNFFTELWQYMIGKI